MAKSTNGTRCSGAQLTIGVNLTLKGWLETARQLLITLGDALASKIPVGVQVGHCQLNALACLHEALRQYSSVSA
ncbi:hypothetical protein [Nostoc sp.]|uniref:hypothetical protein n=1 Tax=Nostoc sp. TaxID=1180 RepID=UPI002FF9AAEC